MLSGASVVIRSVKGARLVKRLYVDDEFAFTAELNPGLYLFSVDPPRGTRVASRPSRHRIEVKDKDVEKINFALRASRTARAAAAGLTVKDAK